MLQSNGYLFNPRSYVNYDRQSTSDDLELPLWWISAIQRVAYLLDLPENWDSYGAEKVDQIAAYNSIQILQQISRPGIPEPSIVPTVNGRLQFEWHTKGIDLEFEVLSSTTISVSYENMNTGDEWEKDLDYNLTPLTDTLKLLISDDNDLGVLAV